MKTKLAILGLAIFAMAPTYAEITSQPWSREFPYIQRNGNSLEYWGGLTNTWSPGFERAETKLYALPASPINGSVIISEERTLQPCFAATLPACPGHWITNHIRWRMERGEWNRIWETNVWIIPPGSNTNTPETNVTVMDPSHYTNLVASNVIQWNFAGATNVVWELEPLTSLQRSNEVLRLEIGALLDAVQLWKNKYQSERYKNHIKE